MIKNNIKELRAKRGLTQRQLAEAAGTSQQQVQRIESGVQAARLDLAERLAAALQGSVQDLFPELRKLPSRKRISSQEDEVSALADAGLEVGATLHRIVLRLQGGHELDYTISSKEVSRIRRNVLSEDRSGFLVFDSSTERVAVNYKALIYSHFLFDPYLEDHSELDEQREREGLKVWLTEGGAPLCFSVDPDNRDEDDEDIGQLEGLFFDLETPYRDDRVVSFVDEDGEQVVLSTSHVAACALPQPFVCQSLLQAQYDGMEEDELIDEDEV